MPMRNLGLLKLILIAICLAWPIAADELEDEGLRVLRDKAGYSLAVTQYETASELQLLGDEAPQHTLSITGLMQAPSDADVLCFRSALIARSARNSKRDELLVPARKRNQDEFAAVLPHPKIKIRRGDAILLAEAELASIELTRPAYEVDELEIEGTAVVVRDRASEEVPAIVADNFHDIGHDTQVKVKAMEIDKKGVMTVKLDIRRAAGDKAAIIDSLYALNADGDIIGGGRWTNELDLFAASYEVEMVFPLNNERKLDKLRVVLATRFEQVPVKFTLEKFFQK